MYTGMMHTGMGPAHANNFLTECNILPISETTLRKKEKEISKSIHHVAMAFCREAQLHEILLSHDKVGYFSEDIYMCIYNGYFLH
jgi:hypothetical protein